MIQDGHLTSPPVYNGKTSFEQNIFCIAICIILQKFGPLLVSFLRSHTSALGDDFKAIRKAV